MKRKISSCELCFQSLIMMAIFFFYVEVKNCKEILLIVIHVLGEDPQDQDLDLKMTKSDSKCVLQIQNKERENENSLLDVWIWHLFIY